MEAVAAQGNRNGYKVEAEGKGKELLGLGAGKGCLVSVIDNEGHICPFTFFKVFNGVQEAITQKMPSSFFA